MVRSIVLVGVAALVAASVSGAAERRPEPIGTQRRDDRRRAAGLGPRLAQGRGHGRIALQAAGLSPEGPRVAGSAGTLPERVDSTTGEPTSTTPLAWSHAFAILALRARYG